MPLMRSRSSSACNGRLCAVIEAEMGGLSGAPDAHLRHGDGSRQDRRFCYVSGGITREQHQLALLQRSRQQRLQRPARLADRHVQDQHTASAKRLLRRCSQSSHSCWQLCPAKPSGLETCCQPRLCTLHRLQM